MTHRARERGRPTGLLSLCLSGLLLTLTACDGAGGASGDVVTQGEVEVAQSTSGLSLAEASAYCCYTGTCTNLVLIQSCRSGTSTMCIAWSPYGYLYLACSSPTP